MKPHFLFLFVFALLLIPFGFAQTHVCLLPIDSNLPGSLPATSCVNGYLHDQAGWCNYEILLDTYPDVFIQYHNAGGSIVEEFNVVNNTINIWVDQTTVPSYLFCTTESLNAKDYVFVEMIGFGKSDEWLPENLNYSLLDKDNIYAKWLFGLLFIFVGAFVLFDAFFNNRFDRFV